MDRERFARVEAIFRAAIAVAPGLREALVREMAGEDESLRLEVDSLLAEDAAAGALDRPLLEAALPRPGSAAENATGVATAGDPWRGAGQLAALDELVHAGNNPPDIPGFRVSRRIGAGGMGVVYEAQQETPRRVVALKVMRSLAPGATSARRFTLEAHVLARLQHPGIAQIFETGTFDGPTGLRPYFAMELVRGEPLTACRTVQALGVAEKLELVAAICDALQHAHQRGVVHRDLKPANILVTEEELEGSTTSPISRGSRSSITALRPKILDFGVARAVGEVSEGETAGTLDGQFVGTLPYMSPEQVATAGSDLDTRSDIYAVGVVAYELLVGRLPYELRGAPPLEAARIIREVDAPRLGTVDRRFAGDVETIVAKALEKDRERRYQSASELAADIRRHLRFEPIMARPHSALDLLVRIVRRHRAASILVALSALLLLGASVVVGLALAVATRERDEAQRQESIARAVNAFVDEDLLGAADAAQADGAFLTVREALDHAAAAIDADRVRDPWVEAALRSTIGRCYRRLGLLDAAEPHLREAMELHRRLVGEDHADAVAATNELAKLRTLQGREEEAIAGYRQVLDAKRRSLGESHQSTIGAMDNLARELRAVKQLDEALELHERANALAVAHLAADNPYRVLAASGLASLYRTLGRLDDAEPIYRDALERSRAIHEPGSQHTLRLMNSLALLETKRGRHREAESLLLEAIASAEARVGRRHPNVLTYLSNLGDLYRAWGRLEDAERVLSECLVAHEETLGRTHRGTLITMEHLADVLEARGEPARAEALRSRVADRREARADPAAAEPPAAPGQAER